MKATETNRLSAFTLVELTLVLVLSAIVSAMLFQGVRTVMRLYQDFNMRQQSLTELRSMYRMLYLDIEKSQRMVVSEDTLKLFYDGGLVTYAGSQRVFVRRTNSHADSIFVETASISTLEMTSDLSPSVTVSFVRNREVFAWRFWKQYSSQQLLLSHGFN